jgi:hypothetical protein
MKIHYYPGFAMLLICWACSDSKPDKKATAAPARVEKKNYFPVLDYLKSEVAFVDSFPLGIVKYRSDRGKKDSAFIKTAEFDSLAREFLAPDLDSAGFEENYSESSFLDQTSQSLTFTYSAINPRNRVKRVDVLATPDPAMDKVKSIYIEKSYSSGDTSFTKKMYWKAKKNFQIISIWQTPNQPAQSSQMKVVWDNHD